MVNQAFDVSRLYELSSDIPGRSSAWIERCVRDAEKSSSFPRKTAIFGFCTTFSGLLSLQLFR
jgi:hypothetical protein